MNINNKMKLTFLSNSINESFARNVIGCFVLSLNPSIADVSDIKTAVSEAVTNCIVHAYPEKSGEIIIESSIIDDVIHISIFDRGVGISNVKQALEPFYTTKPDEERSGMGFTIMKSFMDEVRLESENGALTKIYMSKKIIPEVENAR